MAWTDASDVIESWIGGGAPTDSNQVDIWVGRAERHIRSRVTDLQARIDAEAEETTPRTDLLETARDVVVAMVTRIYRNPNGWRQVQATTGPFSDSGTVGGDNPGTLYLTDDELASLQGVTSRGGAYTIDMIPSTSPFSPSYVQVNPWA